jgi:glutathione synthase/RimK-type ligase-like ATP-grasp enzyme
LFNGEPIYGLLREPPAKQFVSNLAFGGTIRALYLDEIPPELIKKAKILDKRFGYSGPRFFSADWGFDGKEWKLFELNHSTGLVHKSIVGPAADWYSQNLARKLVESAKLENIS